jgi:hypothetical protein
MRWSVMGRDVKTDAEDADEEKEKGRGRILKSIENGGARQRQRDLRTS